MRTATTPPRCAARRRGETLAEEDDCVVLSVLTQADGRSALLVLDGRTHRGVARAVLPCALPNGFHVAFLRT